MGPAAVALAVFVAAAAVDYAAARYTLAMARRAPDGRSRPDLRRAAAWSVTVCLLSTVGLLALVDVSRWMIVPECAGLAAGTLLSGALDLRD